MYENQKMRPLETILGMGERIKENDWGMNSTMVYYKNFCKCNNVPPLQYFFKTSVMQKSFFKSLCSFHWDSEREVIQPYLISQFSYKLTPMWLTIHVSFDDLVPPHKNYRTDITQQPMWGTELYASNTSDNSCTSTGNHSKSLHRFPYKIRSVV
jgi:hypothetical protein